MRINFTVLPDEQSLWTSGYHLDMTTAFTLEGHKVYPVDVKPLLEGKPIKKPDCDVWFVDASMDLLLPDLITLAKNEGEAIVGHAHIGPEVPRIIYPWREDAVKRTQLVIGELDALFFHNEVHKKLFTEFYEGSEMPKLCVTGFPLDLSRYFSVKGNGSILFPHRLTYMKQPLLAALMLEDHKHQTVFSTGWDRDQSSEHKYYYDMLCLEDFNVMTGVKGILYQKLMQAASVVVCTSVAETGCIACVESVLSGALPVMPDLPEFDWYPDRYKYNPYDVSEFRFIVGENILSNEEFEAMDLLREKHDHRLVVKRMLKAIGEIL